MSPPEAGRDDARRAREWWFEDDCGSGSRLGLLVRKVHSRQTKHQQVDVFEHELLGRVLALDGVVQTTTADEFIYHEMLAHVPMLGRPGASIDKEQPCAVLIVGGGDGGTLREVLRHPFVQRVVMVEIDGEVIEVCREHLQIHGDFDDPRVTLIIGDGAEFVGSEAARNDPFDVIVVDSSDPLGGPANPLYTEAFTKDLHGCLAPGGVVVRQYGMPALEGDKLTNGVGHMRAVFSCVQVYRASVPTYLGGDMAFLVGTDGDGCERAFREHSGRWYTPDVHAAAFVLPPAWAEMVSAAGS